MAHHEIQALTDLTMTAVALQNQLGTLKQKSGLGRMLLGGKLLKPAVKIFGNAQIHCHTSWYQNSTTECVGVTRIKAAQSAVGNAVAGPAARSASAHETGSLARVSRRKSSTGHR